MVKSVVFSILLIHTFAMPFEHSIICEGLNQFRIGYELKGSKSHFSLLLNGNYSSDNNERSDTNGTFHSISSSVNYRISSYLFYDFELFKINGLVLFPSIGVNSIYSKSSGRNNYSNFINNYLDDSFKFIPMLKISAQKKFDRFTIGIFADMLEINFANEYQENPNDPIKRRQKWFSMNFEPELILGYTF